VECVLSARKTAEPNYVLYGFAISAQFKGMKFYESEFKSVANATTVIFQ
jgi:hypothetical protein